jgi:hypothetical protein
MSAPTVVIPDHGALRTGCASGRRRGFPSVLCPPVNRRRRWLSSVVASAGMSPSSSPISYHPQIPSPSWTCAAAGSGSPPVLVLSNHGGCHAVPRWMACRVILLLPYFCVGLDTCRLISERLLTTFTFSYTLIWLEPWIH